MEIAVYGVGFIAVCFGAAATVAGLKDHAYTGLWMVVCGLIATTISGGLWVHDLWSKRDRDVAEALRAADREIITVTVPTLSRPLAAGTTPGIDVRFNNSAPISVHVLGTSASTTVAAPGKFDIEAAQIRNMKLAQFHEVNWPLTPADDMAFRLQRNDLSETNYADIISGQKVLNVASAVLYEDSMGRLRASACTHYWDPAEQVFFSAKPTDQKQGIVVDKAKIATPKTPRLALAGFSVSRYVAGEKVSYDLEFYNSGGTPALNGRGAYQQVFEVPYDAVWEEIRNTVDSIEPKDGDWRVNGLATLTVQVPGESVVPPVSDKGQTLYVFGRLEFLDEAGGKHWTTYCLAYDGTTYCPYEPLCATDTNEYGEK